MLDEPLNGIDLIGRDQIIQSILRAANPNATILISSHLFDELEPIVDHIVMMANGSLVLEGELEEIRTRYGKSISDLYREYFPVFRSRHFRRIRRSIRLYNSIT